MSRPLPPAPPPPKNPRALSAAEQDRHCRWLGSVLLEAAQQARGLSPEDGLRSRGILAWLAGYADLTEDQRAYVVNGEVRS